MEEDNSTLVLLAAREELRRENFRKAVEVEKERLRNKRPLLHRLFPWTISINRRKS